MVKLCTVESVFTVYDNLLWIISDISELSIVAEVQEMPCYPTDGSVRIIDGVVVFKFSEP